MLARQHWALYLVSIAVSHVEVALPLSQSDPPLRQQSFLRMPTLASASGCQVDARVASVVRLAALMLVRSVWMGEPDPVCLLDARRAFGSSQLAVDHTHQCQLRLASALATAASMDLSLSRPEPVSVPVILPSLEMLF